MKFCFPESDIRTEKREDQDWVWDPIRKKWFVLQPEEYVRQQLIQYMIQHKGISASLIGVEKAVDYRGMSKRFDIVVFDRQGMAFILIECKAPNIKLSEDTLHQIARYNVSIGAPHLLLTNGLSLLFFSRDDQGKYQYQADGWYE
ncbi:MAG: type I restriction enzyme HsdR N-terminal domain-containing protein [Bacteroidota bacterium]